MSNLTELLERVKTATGRDDTLDMHIGRELAGPPPPGVEWTTDSEYWPQITASIDAAVALVERVLPGKGIRMWKGFRGPYSMANIVDKPNVAFGPEPSLGHCERADDELPLAILAAMLSALIAREEPPHG